MVGCANAVKRVQIDVHYLFDPFPGWEEVIQRMRAVASKWRVVGLKVAMHPYGHQGGGHDVDMGKYMDNIAGVVRALTALMPDVRRMGCQGSDRSQAASLICGFLAWRYADQLRWFDSNHRITVPPGCQFTRLRLVSLSYDLATDYQIPQMAAGELVDVMLMDGPSNHSWASFSADSDSRVIEFTNLKGLLAVYRTTHLENEVAVRHRDGHPWKLQFPRLESLNIQCGENICPLLEYAVLPSHMESIQIQLRSATYQDHTNLVLPATKRLILGITGESEGDPSGLPVINRFFESARGSESLELHINDRMLPVVPDSITCTALTHLLVAARTSVDTMLAFIERLPNLTELTLYTLDLSDTQADISVPGADEDTVVEPLHTWLESLTIEYDISIHSPDTATAVVKYMLLRIPTLFRLVSRMTPEGLVLSFVEQYAPRYPHLRGVEMELCRGDLPEYAMLG
ncbi:hypothetical protein H4R21_000495 [Coemansia helicoidea]|uniref:Uncharacterized protein n=1 Tax=Coemansia helicoidea TaxID=1286919 RepID=A0ACC1LFV1_9FUNG|nr:hypothetical protein H4R21_000495 [Coemansia helicoidea]